MKLYHGSTVIIEEPNIQTSNSKTSFGKGFYTSTNKDTAMFWAEEKKKRILGRDRSAFLKIYINVYEFIENKKLNILDFDKIEEPAYSFIGRNKRSNELLHNYDIVKGPQVTRKLLKILKGYKARKIKREDFLNMMIMYRTINEISFHTEKAIKTLRFLYFEEII